ncbi:MAG TPA: SURF1 family protein [Hydrogenophaga sp.]|uniref:SURF1 family protein n=1 Tax=Hydrogenophaga sp. TaxID=1904254 RepID=UPI002CA9A9B2|nr:SURF1 family protein [Hydrogenophaga sp.]HMN94438.1 SURF1 family protein [Hydrogenophaga sp.]HMP09366.1 SURF1 family protein [Hydrogenophaga sp.]
MKPRSWRFWVVLLATATTLVVTASLGLWQMGRAAQKQALFERIERRGQEPWLTTEALSRAQDLDALLHRKAGVQGRWVPQHTVFLDNRQMNAIPGFFVITPLQLQGSDRYILVQRGWVPRDFHDRTRLPKVPTPTDNPVAVEGRLSPWPAKLYELGQAGLGPIRQNIDIEAFSAETGLNLLDVSILQTGPDLGDGLLREWPRIESGVAKHHGYAFQWFGLCALTAALFVWFQLIAPRRKPTSP